MALSRSLGWVPVLATGAVIAATLSAPAGATAKSTPDDRGAAWLERQLIDGLVYNEQYDFNDYGLTADVGIDLGTPVVEAIGAERRSRFTGRIPKVTVEIHDATPAADRAVRDAREAVARQQD